MPSQQFIDQLETRRQTCQQRAEQILARAKAAGRDTLTAEEDREVQAAIADLQTLNERLEDEREDLRRMGDPSTWPGAAHRTRPPQSGSGRLGVPNTAGQLAPLGFDHDEMRRLQTAAQRRDPCRLETRAFSTADSLLPATLWPYPVEHVHEARMLDRLPGIAFDTPAITFIRHISTTGTAAPTVEGGTKPELVFNTDALTEPAVKIAGHVGLSYEIINDFEAFSSTPEPSSTGRSLTRRISNCCPVRAPHRI
jgi:HK97 family phage major capsid protein